jgi:iron only hydrogenase large subunit-like protein
MMKQTDRPVHALLAPSFVGQFGSKASPMAVRAGLQLLGFTDVIEVAKGAEIVAAAEAREFSEKMADGKELMTSSCCPAFVALIDKHYPNLQQSVSHTPSPMAVIASEIKKQNPRALTVFIGPCVAKKAEAADLRDVDAVLTFAELACLWEAAEIDLTTIDIGADLHDAGRFGRGFAKSGGVTQALLNALGNDGPEPKAVKADGLAEARQLLTTASKNCLAANFIEGMACQGGCIAGPGTLVDKRVAERQLDRHCQAGEPEPNERAAGTN